MGDNQRISFSRIDGKIGVRHLPDSLKSIYKLDKDIVDQIILTDEHLNDGDVHFSIQEVKNLTIDNLDSEIADRPLSANQGRILNNKIDQGGGSVTERQILTMTSLQL